ncbi:MAG: glucose-6-phosphate dehydrogenase assembly protein OpcA [Actinomycetota bacterium]|nr:glucose-6-phosphate dehydrogenase assembly protein OpcA [Actinomycetota bacterium]
MANAVNERADVVELCSWQGEGVGVGDVLDALERLRRGQQRTATRTSVVSLVVVATDEDEARRACDADRLLGGRHPGRTITVRCMGEAEDGPRIDADVVLEGAGDVWWEEVQLRVAGPVTSHLDSLIEPLVLADLPTALWFAGRLPEWDDPLLRTADAVLVDSKEAPQDSSFALIEQLLRHHPVVDLSWVRLRPWRVLLAGLFEGSTYRPFVHRVSSVSVAGKPGPRRLLAGWLVSRLGLSPSAVTLGDDRHVQVRLEADGACFEVTRQPGERVVRASARVAGGPGHEDVLSLPDQSLPWSLGEALTHLGRDKVYEQSLHALLGFAS